MSYSKQEKKFLINNHIAYVALEILMLNVWFRDWYMQSDLGGH